VTTTRVNFRLLTVLVGTFAVLGLSVHWLHGYQARRSAGELLELAEQARKDGNLRQAAEHFRLYLGYSPQDTEVCASFALATADLARTFKQRLGAFLLLEQVLRQAPQRRDLLRRAADLAMSVGRFTEAEDHLWALLRTNPADAEVEALLGACYERKQDFDKAARHYEQAVLLAPSRLDTCERLATLERDQLNHPEQAAKVLSEMIAQNPRVCRAWLIRAADGIRLGNLDSAAKDIQQALALEPNNADALLAAAELSGARGDRAAARDQGTRGCQLHPEDARFPQLLARLAFASGQREEAVVWLRKCLDRQCPPEQLWNVAELLLQAEEATSAKKVIERLPSGWQPERVRYLEAHLLLVQKNWLQASRQLEALRPLLEQEPALATSADLLLAACYAGLGNPDLQARAYLHALKLNPMLPEALRGLAEVLTSQGRTDEALAQYRKLQAVWPAARLASARLLLMRNLRLPPGQQDWARVDQLLDEAAQAQLNANDIFLLRVEKLAAQERFAEARRLLEEERLRQPRLAALWIALAGLAMRQGDFQGTIATLEEARRQLGDRSDLRLALAQAWSFRGDAAARAALDGLAQGLERFSRTEQAALIRGLADAQLRLRADREAAQLLARLEKLGAADLESYRLRFEVAVAARDQTAQNASLAAVRAIEGEEGPLAGYGAAAWALQQARDGDRSLLSLARKRLTQVLEQRPSWSRAWLLQARLEEEDNHEEAALESYRRAVETGERQPAVIRRLALLLCERHRYREADEVLHRLADQNQAPLTGDLCRLSAAIALSSQDLQRALSLAQAAVSAKSTDFRDYVWLGRVLCSAGQQAEAEKTLRSTVARFEQVPDAWVALVQFLADTHQHAAAEAVLKDVRTKLPARELPLVLAQCYEVLGRLDEAERFYQALLADKPDSVASLRQVADFYLRTGRPQKAEAPLRRLILLVSPSTDEAALWGRRNLALVLGLSGAQKGLAEATKLLEQNFAVTGGTPDDKRVQAVLLALQPGQRRAAIQTLEECFVHKPASSDELFLLARLYDSERNWPQARERLLTLLATGEPRAEHLAYFIDGLLRHSGAAEIAPWLARLEKREPGAYRTAELRARLLAAQGQNTQAIGLLQDQVKRNPEKVGAAAAALDRLGLMDAAEPLYRRWAAQADDPKRRLLLAAFLSRRGKAAEAIDLCERLGDSFPPEVIAGICVDALRGSCVGPELVSRVERRLQEALAREPDRDELLLQWASLRDVQGKYPEAMAIYRRILQRDRNNLVALNNLAWLLSFERGGAGEAQELIDRALRLSGEPQAGLLDTRAVINLRQDHAQQAVKDLEEAMALAPTPGQTFHLAQAYLAAGNQGAAAATLLQAQQHGLAPRALHPLEQQAYQQLLSQLNPT
jgi:tetratricopeptide (TPR) repeat protein